MCDHLGLLHLGLYTRATTIVQDRGIHCLCSHHLAFCVRRVVDPSIFACLSCRKPQTFVNITRASQVHHLSIPLLFFFALYICTLLTLKTWTLCESLTIAAVLVGRDRVLWNNLRRIGCFVSPIIFLPADYELGLFRVDVADDVIDSIHISAVCGIRCSW